MEGSHTMKNKDSEGVGWLSAFTCFRRDPVERTRQAEGRWDSLGSGMQCDCERDIRRKSQRRDDGSNTPSQSCAGVGIVFQEELMGAGGLIVEHVLHNGPAYKAGNIERGMILVSIDNVDVRSMRSEQMASLILGPVDSEVVLGFETVDGANGHLSKGKRDIKVKVVREVVRQ